MKKLMKSSAVLIAGVLSVSLLSGCDQVSSTLEKGVEKVAEKGSAVGNGSDYDIPEWNGDGDGNSTGSLSLMNATGTGTTSTKNSGRWVGQKINRDLKVNLSSGAVISATKPSGMKTQIVVTDSARKVVKKSSVFLKFSKKRVGKKTVYVSAAQKLNLGFYESSKAQRYTVDLKTVSKTWAKASRARVSFSTAKSATVRFYDNGKQRVSYVKKNNRSITAKLSKGAIEIHSASPVKVKMTVSDARSGKVVKSVSTTVKVSKVSGKFMTDAKSFNLGFYEGSKSSSYRVTMRVDGKNWSRAVRTLVKLDGQKSSTVSFYGDGLSKVSYAK